MNKNIYLVTGGAGLLGRSLAYKLQKSGKKVRIFDFQTPQNLPDEIEFFRGDIRNISDLSPAFKNVKKVFHLAALMHVGKIDKKKVYEVNVIGLKNILKCSEEEKIERLIFTSTIELYGTKPTFPCYENSPKNPPPGYPTHKLLGEKLVMNFYKKTGIPVVIIRMPMIFGPGFYHFKPIFFYFDLILKNLPVFVMDGGEKQGKFVALSDAVDGLILAGEKDEAIGEVFNICSEDTFTHKGLLEEIIKRVESKSKIHSINSKLVILCYEILNLLGISPVAKEHFYFSLHDCVYDITKAKKLLGYNPKKTSPDAVIETLNYYRKHKKEMRKRKIANIILK